MRGQNAFVFNLNMIIHIFLHLSNAFSAGPAAGQGACRLLEAPSRRLRPFRPPDPCRNLVLLPKNGRRQGGKTPHSAKFWEPEPLRPPGSLVPPAAGPPCRQGSPKEPLRATAGKVRRSAKNSFQGRSFPFLSTLPVRGATCYSWRSRYRRWYFYPRSPQGERQRTFPSLPISPLFLSTLPAKGSDPSATGAAPGWPYFYPHSPQGERREPCALIPRR